MILHFCGTISVNDIAFFVGPSVPEDTGLPPVILCDWWSMEYSNTLRLPAPIHMYICLVIHFCLSFAAPKPTPLILHFLWDISARTYTLTICNSLTIVGVWSSNTLNLPAPIYSLVLHFCIATKPTTSNKRLSMILYFLWEYQCQNTQAYSL